MNCSTPGFPVLTVSWSLLRLCPLMPSDHLILCHPLLLPSIFPSIRIFSNESALCIRWPKYWSFRFSISPPNEYSGLISSALPMSLQGRFALGLTGLMSLLLSYFEVWLFQCLHSSQLRCEHLPGLETVPSTAAQNDPRPSLREPCLARVQLSVQRPNPPQTPGAPSLHRAVLS